MEDTVMSKNTCPWYLFPFKEWGWLNYQWFRCWVTQTICIAFLMEITNSMLGMLIGVIALIAITVFSIILYDAFTD